jgi:hypothetical protein
MSVKVITTVLASAASYDLTTLAVVKDELSISDGSSDATLKRYLSWASAALSQECNRIFPVETVKDEIWPVRQLSPVMGGMAVLQLSRWPLVSVTSITENGILLVDGTDFRSDNVNGQILRLDGSGNLRSWPALPLVAVFSGGFANIPGDLADAVTRMTRNRFKAKGRDSYLVSEDVPGVRNSRWWIATGNEAGNVPPDVADLIDSYRVPVIA